MHLPIRVPTDQRVQPRAIHSQRPQVAYAKRKATPDSLVQTEEHRLQPLTQIAPARRHSERSAAQGLANSRSYCSSSDTRAPSTPCLIVRRTPLAVAAGIQLGPRTTFERTGRPGSTGH